MVVLVISLMSSDDELNYYYAWIEFSNDYGQVAAVKNQKRQRILIKDECCVFYPPSVAFLMYGTGCWLPGNTQSSKVEWIP